MTVAENILRKANKEIKRLKEEQDKSYRELHLMKIYVNSLKEEILKCKCQINANIVKKDSNTIIKTEHDNSRKEAMERYTAKLKKENLKYAKQKQGQRKSSRTTSSESSEGIRDQSSSSICK